MLLDLNQDQPLGTSGSFNIVINATKSEVDLRYIVKSIDETNKPHNFKYFFDNNEYNSFSDIEESLTGIIYANDEIKTRTFEIKWEWKFETGDTEEEILKNDFIDTQDMQNIRLYNFTIFVSGEQVKLQIIKMKL